MRPANALVLAVLALIALAALIWLERRIQHAAPEADVLDTRVLLATAPEQFRRITGPEPLSFPADHAAHPGYRNEWWYFTGNLAAADGTRYGFQFTLFRFGLPPDAMPPESDFSADAIWMGHLALSDLDRRQFFNCERVARGALGLAGASADRWWLRDWEVHRSGAGWQLRAACDSFSLDLALKPLKPLVLHGQDGYSRKGSEPGNASRYYGVTRIAADGRLVLGGVPRALDGLAWLDREWGSSQLGEGIDGWDWFALQLADGRDLMLYRLRTRAGAASRYSAGTLVAADGTATALSANDFDLTPGRWWRDREGIRWPLDWRLRVPAAGLDARVRAVFDQQCWDTRVEYWEGAVEVLNSTGEARIGRGYLELSGYADAVRRAVN